ncbi:APC family permease [Oenococcus sicerae]|uniref:APC family permease n=1 Tax=Oenococcus sicerae TaxID=2203724 RepID=A0AAJ1RCM9_9LACO|nr:APC family permease [Oenococcus sicerae]MDN6900510.1 APC family permease [Oenococcus sicerae]
MWKYLKRVLIGKPLKTNDTGSQSLNIFKALALLSSDALSSVAYGTEMITTALLAGGAAALWFQLPIAALVLVLLGAIALSYVMIIHAYPSGGGAYAVASQNWGHWVGLVAGGSLLVDYMLTVAVSAASATDAISSAIPEVHHFALFLSVVIVILLMLMNLRGLRESANFLMVPVYFFILAMFVMLAVGFVRLGLGQIVYHAPTLAEKISPTMSVGFLLFMKAFSSGSSSLTGVEAISNSVPNFNKPKEHNAAKTLIILVVILGLFFGSITFFSFFLGIVPNGQTTVMAQIADAIFGRNGIGFYIFQLATALILTVAANTGFSAFPMLAFNMANDKFMPHLFKDKGDRLGYSNGIVSLSVGAIVLLLVFKGRVEALIPLYAVGVFVPFTLSQSGMIIHWWRQRGSYWVFKAFVNFVGAMISFVLVISMFGLHFAGVWPYLILMPVLLRFFYGVHYHYVSIAKQLKLTPAKARVHRHDYDGAMVIVFMGNVTRVTVSAMDYARSIGDEVIGMHVSFDTNIKKERETAKEFEKYFPGIRYVDIHSSYRSVIQPSREFIDSMSKQATKRNWSLTIMVPQFVPKHWWQNAMHNQTAFRLRNAFISRDDITISSYYYHLRD